MQFFIILCEYPLSNSWHIVLANSHESFSIKHLSLCNYQHWASTWTLPYYASNWSNLLGEPLLYCNLIFCHCICYPCCDIDRNNHAYYQWHQSGYWRDNHELCGHLFGPVHYIWPFCLLRVQCLFVTCTIPFIDGVQAGQIHTTFCGKQFGLACPSSC